MVVDNFSQAQNQMLNNNAWRYWIFDDMFLGNKCLKVVRGVEGQALNWTQALEYCRAQPGVLPDLASISSEEEQSKNVNPVWILTVSTVDGAYLLSPRFNQIEFKLRLLCITNRLTRYPCNCYADIVLAHLRDVEAGLWIGMHLTVMATNDWLWVDNSHVNYSHWLPGEPSYVRTRST